MGVGLGFWVQCLGLVTYGASGVSCRPDGVRMPVPTTGPKPTERS